MDDAAVGAVDPVPGASRSSRTPLLVAGRVLAEVPDVAVAVLREPVVGVLPDSPSIDAVSRTTVAVSPEMSRVSSGTSTSMRSMFPSLVDLLVGPAVARGAAGSRRGRRRRRSRPGPAPGLVTAVARVDDRVPGTWSSSWPPRSSPGTAASVVSAAASGAAVAPSLPAPSSPHAGARSRPAAMTGGQGQIGWWWSWHHPRPRPSPEPLLNPGDQGLRSASGGRVTSANRGPLPSPVMSGV